MLKYGQDNGKCATRGSNTVNVAQFANGSSAPAKKAAMPTISSQCGLRSRTDRHARYPKNATVQHHRHGAGDQRPVGHPEKRGIGRFRAGSGLVVRGSPCRPVCMFAHATAAKTHSVTWRNKAGRSSEPAPERSCWRGEVTNPEQRGLDLIDIAVARNGYGRQVDSFLGEVDAPALGGAMPAVFIRAPRIRRTGPGVEILATHRGKPCSCASATCPRRRSIPS